MKKFFSIIILVLVTIVNVQAQNDYRSYMRFGYNAEITNFDNGYEVSNNCLNVQIGTFVSDKSAFEFDFKHGFEKNNLSNLRFGVNYRLHCDMLYFKMGVGYKQFRINIEDDWKEKFDGCDVRLGFGLSLPLSDRAHIDMGLDFSHFFNKEFNHHKDFFDAIVFEPVVGLRFDF